MAKQVLVSGGSGGIGAAVCLALAKSGIQPVIGYCHSVDKAHEIAARTKGFAITLDLSLEHSIDHAIASLTERCEGLDGIILAASPPILIGPFGKITEEEMFNQWQVNVAGPRRLLAGLIKGIFRKNRAGKIIAVLSKAMGNKTEHSAPNMAAYIIAKYGLSGVLKAVESEFSWLTTDVVYPTFTETKMLDTYDPRFLDQMRRRSPLGRFDAPDEVAETIVAKYMVQP